MMWGCGRGLHCPHDLGYEDRPGDFFSWTRHPRIDDQQQAAEIDDAGLTTSSSANTDIGNVLKGH